jgi:RNase P/RNase MRP subunit p29
VTPDRIDDLLQRALASGRLPDDATEAERAEIAPLLAASGALKLNSARVAAEANAAMPTARARFQRHLQAQAPVPVRQAVQAVAPVPRPGMFGRLLGVRTMALGSSVAVMAIIAIVALVVLQPFSNVETASALTVDDYVQVEGVVSTTDGATVTVQSSTLGNLDIAISDLTSVSNDQGTVEAASLKAGDPVLISGIVTAKRAIAASNVAVAQNTGTTTVESRPKAALLKAFRQGLEGKVTVLALSPDGARARVLLVTKNESLLVDVDPKSMDQFLAQTPRTIGAQVRVVEAPDLPKGVFRLQLVDQTGGTTTPGTSSAAPQFQNIRGVVVSRRADILMVRTDRGTVPVVLKLTTSIRFGSSGLTAQDIRAGESVVGYEVAVSGNLDAASGRRVIATLIVVIGKGASATP